MVRLDGCVSVSLLVFICCGLPANGAAQLPSAATSAPLSAETSSDIKGPIQDNSFLIEEAYNQEKGVVQHASFFTYFPGSEDWEYSFTQEWPLPGDERHQLSYTLPVLNAAEFPGSGAGLGDVSFHYRYQLLGSGSAPLAVSPRLSLFLPSGDSTGGRGLGGVAMQANLPVSVVLAPRWVTHLNAGGTLAPAAQNELGDTSSITGFNLGQSFVWLAHPSFNVLLETAWTGEGSVAGEDQTGFAHELFLSPAVRWAHDFDNGLQIVPGAGYAVGVGPSEGNRDWVFYLSFEHPFGHSR